MLTPQELMDLPGAGSAEKQLRKEGRWDEELCVDESGETEYEFVVKVMGSYLPIPETQKHTVTANSIEEAKEKAEDMTDFDEIDGCEIVSAKEK